MRGDGRVFRRGATWWIAYMAPDPETKRRVEVRESTKSEDETVAQKLLRQRIRESANDREGIKQFAGVRMEKLTVGNLLDALEAHLREKGIKSLRHTLGHMKPLRESLDTYPALKLTTGTIRGYIDDRKEDGVSGATINRETALLNQAFELAIKEERITRKPHVPRLQEGNARTGFFEPEQHEAMLAHLAAPLGDMARFAYITGWRQEEVRTLRWEHVDREAREVRLPDTKNGEGRAFPLDEDLGALFDRLWSQRAYLRRGASGVSAFVFHVQGRVVSDSQFSRLWIRARGAGGAIVAGRIFHDYRRTAVRNLIRAGVPQSVAMKITGHKSDSIFRRYNITSTADQVEAVTKLRAYLGGRTTGGNVAELKANSDKLSDKR